MAVQLDACIQCTLCVRACREVQVNDVIGMAGRGAHEKIVFDFDDPMGQSTCVACGECVQACPTGRLDARVGPRRTRADQAHVPDREVDSLCPYCGVGCQLTFQIESDRLLSVDGRDGPANHNRLCVKGRFGFDYIHHPNRLTTPLIRKPGVPKHADDAGRSGQPVDPLPRGDLGRGARRRRARDCVRIRDRDGAAARWPDSARPRGRTRRRTCSRSWCASGSAATTSITARGSATPRASPP